MSKYEQARYAYISHVQSGCCNYGCRLTSERRITVYPTVWNMCSVGRALLENISCLF